MVRLFGTELFVAHGLSTDFHGWASYASVITLPKLASSSAPIVNVPAVPYDALVEMAYVHHVLLLAKRPPSVVLSHVYVSTPRVLPAVL